MGVIVKPPVGKLSFIVILSFMRHAAWVALLNWFDATVQKEG